MDGVQDPGNLGTLVRSAVAFDLDAVLCLDGTVDPWSAKAVRASAGLVFRLPVLRCDEAAALSALREAHVPLVVTSADGDDASARGAGGSFGLAVGNEGAGVRASLRAAADHTLSVRMPGGTDSLNVAVAGAILLYTLTSDDAHG